jgi:hypothetical protein
VEAVQAHTHSLQSTLTYVFAPMHKRALGVALGVVSGALMVFATVVPLVVPDPLHQPGVALLAQFFYGYSVTWPGLVVGFFWGFGIGFVVGWSLALIRNVFTALWLLSVRAKGTLSGPFLDEI